jgi:hypothetical protein
VDFVRVIDKVSRFLVSRDYPFAVIGGISMTAYGMVRTTFDVDLVTIGDGQSAVVDFLESEGYKTIHRSVGYSNHTHPDPDMGQVDVVYVRGETSDALFADVRQVEGPDELLIPVLRAEHLAAMKIFAIKNDPSRTLSELEDIRFLLTLEGIDRNEVRRYFEKHELGRLYDEVT